MYPKIDPTHHRLHDLRYGLDDGPRTEAADSFASGQSIRSRTASESSSAGLDLPVTKESKALIATIEGPRGRVEWR